MKPWSRDCSVRERGVPTSTGHRAAAAKGPGWAADTSHSETSLPTSTFVCPYWRLNSKKTYGVFRETSN